MDSTSGAGKPPGEKSTDEAHGSLEVIEHARRQAYAPMRYPRWYWASVAVVAALSFGLLNLGNSRLAIPLAVVNLILGFIVAFLGKAKVRDLNLRQLQVRGMPRRLAAAYVGPPIAGFLLIIGIGCAVFLIGWPRPWLVLAACSVVGILLLGPVCDRIYRRAYVRWLPDQTP